MKGCRHSGVRVIIPPKRAAQPTRITCRLLRKEKSTITPPLNEGEALASRILEMGPQNCKFLGPVIIEMPHFASLRGNEREILVLRSDTGEKWYEHPTPTSDNALEEALGVPLESSVLNEDPVGGDDDSKSRITRIISHDFPKYFALVSRVKFETHAVGELGGVISSTVVPKAQAVFPEKALQKKIKLSLQAMPIPVELVAKLFGNLVSVSPIVTIEPRRRKFHKAITLTIPLPKSHNALKGSSGHLRLLCSITGSLSPAQWEDITGHTPLSYVDECASFTTTVSARFWLIDCMNYQEVTKMASELYREAIAVPFVSRFVVYAKRHELNECKLRLFCLTDDKEDEKTLEKRENFQIIAKSKNVEVYENRTQWLDMVGNIMPVTKSGEQMNFVFNAFKENRLQFVARVKDANHNAAGRLALFKDARNFASKSEAKQMPLVTLDLDLPEFNKESLDAEAQKRLTLSKSYQLSLNADMDSVKRFMYTSAPTSKDNLVASKKDLLDVNYEDRDFTRESESVEMSDSDDAVKKALQIHSNKLNAKQRKTSSSSLSSNIDSTDEFSQQQRANFASPVVANLDYCRKIDKEYEAIKQNLLNRASSPFTNVASNPSISNAAKTISPNSPSGTRKNFALDRKRPTASYSAIKSQIDSDYESILNGKLSANTDDIVTRKDEIYSNAILAGSQRLQKSHSPSPGADDNRTLNNSYYDNLDNLNELGKDISEHAEAASQRDNYVYQSHEPLYTDDSSSQHFEEHVVVDDQLFDILKHVREAEERTKQLEEIDEKLNATIEQIKKDRSLKSPAIKITEDNSPPLEEDDMKMLNDVLKNSDYQSEAEKSSQREGK